MLRVGALFALVAGALVSASLADDPLLDVAFDGPPGWRMVPEERARLMPLTPYLSHPRYLASAACCLLTARQVDRFAGFRYEVSGHVIGVGFRQAAAEAAEELGCFGWAQNTARGTVVGEVRCAKVLAPQMKEWLRNGPPSARVDQVPSLCFCSLGA